jgi:hypothetical protein
MTLTTNNLIQIHLWVSAADAEMRKQYQKDAWKKQGEDPEHTTAPSC